MAAPTTKSSIGSISWIANERATIQQLREQDAEDFTFSARNDLEWLNEHMADIFEQGHVDMAELLKTPGRLRGQKTPRTGQKQVRPGQGREPTDENIVDNPFFTGYGASSFPSNKQISSARGASKSPTRSLQVLQDSVAKKLAGDSATSVGQTETSQLSVTDSGIWSDFQSQQAQQVELPLQRTSLVSEAASDNQIAERDSTYRTTPVDSSDPHPQSPMQTKNVVSSQIGSKAPEEPGPTQLSPTNSVASSQKLDKKSASEPRRSGRLTGRSSSLVTSPNMEPEHPNLSVPSSPPNVSFQKTSVEGEEESSILPALQPSISSPVPTKSVRPQTPTRSPEQIVESAKNSPTAQTPEAEGSSPSRSSSESPAPEIPIVRKSILNFASLPAREPLTNKKKSLGMKHTRDSHVEQVRLNGASRASWMNRKGNGKSLGASSKQIEQTEVEEKQVEEEGEKVEEAIVRSEDPKSLKRKSEKASDGSRKKSKGNDDEEESSGETSKAVALHNKTSTQRLHDKIQQLGKLNASREARSLPQAISQNSGVVYPDLPQTEKESVAAPKRTKSDSQGQLPSAAAVGRWTSQVDDEEEWIPMKIEPKQTLVRSHTEGATDSKKEPESVSTRWNNSPKRVVASQPVPVRAMTTSESVPNLRSPTTIRNMAPSPLKATFSDDWIKSPTSPPTKAFSDDWIKSPTSPPAKPPGEGAISAVKAHTSSVFKKAKEMLLKSSVSSASAKIETVNPALRAWHSGHNLREQPRNDGSRSPQESAKQTEHLYPDLGSILAKGDGKPSSTKNSPVGSLREAWALKEFKNQEIAVEPARESRQTRSSQSRDIRDDSPDFEQLAVKVQKKGKTAERTEREEKLREREEKLRQAEEELRLAKEEQRKEREEEQRKEREQQERKHKEEQLWKEQEELLRQAEEELRQAKEQQRKHREEQMRKDREESKRRQEERLKQEKEELKRRQQEELRRQQEEAKKAKEIPSGFQDEEDFTGSEEDDDAAEAELRARITSSAEPDRPPSRLQKVGSIRFQKTRDTKPPQRPGTASKDQPKIKGAPVSISVGTASQREMQSQRSKPQAPSTSTLVAALKQSFENPSLMNSSSQISLNSSTSTNSLRSSNLGGSSKPLKSLTAAANKLKKDEKERERKLAVKREIEHRRLENQRRQEEEARKARQKQAPTSTQKTLARTQAVANLRQTSEEPERRLDLKTSVGTKPALVKTAVKRAFQPEATEDQQQYRQAPTKPGAPSYQQDAAKKRRTGEYDERSYEMAPPIRQSVAKKETMSKSAMPHGYTQAPSSTVPSMLRPPTKPGMAMPQVDSVKFSKGAIRFANDTAPGPSTGPSSTPSTFKTPGSKSSSKIHMLKSPAGAKDSPIYQNGELIDLPDIPTDSDEDDDYPPKDNFHVPQWAESPILRGLLEDQQTVNPEDIFGPMARLDMDAIFQNRTDRQAQRFRARTSSANWSGADRLTPDEIAADMEARRKMIEQGGWKYQPPQ